MLIENLDSAKKMWSMWGLAAQIIVNAGMAAWGVYEQTLSPELFAAVNIGFGAFIAVLRVLKQNLESEQK
jgi:hypothetical protein